MVFAERLKVLRESQQLSRQALADATGLSVHSISSYENGRREPNSKALTISRLVGHTCVVKAQIALGLLHGRTLK